MNINYFIPYVELFAKSFSFISVIGMTHILTIKEMGYYSIIVTLVMIVSVFMDGGVNNKIFSLILQNKEKKISDFYTIKIIFSFLSIVLIGVYSYFVYDFWLGIVLYILMTFCVSQIIMYKLIYRAKQIVSWDIICIIVDPTVKLIIIVTLLLYKIKIELYWLLLIFLISSIFEYFIILLYFNKHFNFIKFSQITISKFILLFNELKYYIIYYFIYILYLRVDIFFINNYLNSNEVAIYYSAYNIYNSIIIFITALITSTFPQIKYFSLRNKLFFYKEYFILYFVLLIISHFVLKKIYLIIYPQCYLDGAVVLFWLLCSLPCLFVSYLIIFNLNFKDLEKYNIIPLIIVLILKLISFLVFRDYLLNVVIFSKFYFLFEIILFLLFLVLYKFLKSISKRSMVNVV